MMSIVPKPQLFTSLQRKTPLLSGGGFTLIEVLVTIIILAIGFLGIAGLQLSALQNNNSAYERSQASILAYDIIDRMRANRNSALNGNYDTNIADAPGTQDCQGSGANCSVAQLTEYDVNQWKCSLGRWNAHASCIALGITGKLPAGDGSIALNGSQITISLQWDDKRHEEAAADRLTTFTITTTL